MLDSPLDSGAAEKVLRELLEVDREYKAEEGRFVVGSQPDKRQQIYDRIVKQFDYEKGSRFRIDDLSAPDNVRSLLDSGMAVVILACPDQPDHLETWTRRW